MATHTTLGKSDVRPSRNSRQPDGSVAPQTETLGDPLVSNLIRKPLHPAVTRFFEIWWWWGGGGGLNAGNLEVPGLQEDEGNLDQEPKELIPRLVGGTSTSTTQPWKTEDAKKEADLAISCNDWLQKGRSTPREESKRARQVTCNR